MEKAGSTKETIISNIIELEWKMFSGIVASEPSECQHNEKTFRLMRWMSYSVFSNELLNSILINIKAAINCGRNLMTEKYARMEGKIPPLKELPAIDEIAKAETELMKEVADKYPFTFRENKEGFDNYLKCELETYSDESLNMLNDFIKESQKNNINIVEERYNNLFQRLGYDSLKDKESEERHKEFWKNNSCRGC